MKKSTLASLVMACALLNSPSVFADDFFYSGTPKVVFTKTFPGAATNPAIEQEALAACSSALDKQVDRLIDMGMHILQRVPCRVDKAGYVGISGFESVRGEVYFIR